MTRARKTTKAEQEQAEREAFEILKEKLGGDLAHDIIIHRRNLEHPLTGRGAKGLLNEYERFGDVVKAAEYHLNMGWRGFDASWVKQSHQVSIGSANVAETRGDYVRRMMREQEERWKRQGG